MKRLPYVVAFGLLLLGVAAFAQTSYTTNFPATENPVSQGGDWVNGKTNGAAWNNVQTLAGVAMGTQPGTGIYDDSIAALTGTWAEAQSASITVAVPSSLGAQYDEVEVHIHVTIAANSATGYEGYCPVTGSSSADPMQIVRWNGPKANSTNSNNGYTVLKGVSGVSCGPGDVLKIADNGAGALTLTKNGNAEVTVTRLNYSKAASSASDSISRI